MKSKITILFTSLLLLCSSAFASKVTIETAKNAGYQFLIHNGYYSIIRDAGALSLAYTGTDATAGDCFYVFNVPHGFVMVAADDAVMPVIAYSTDHSFDGAHVEGNVAFMLDGYKKQISYVAVHSLGATPEIAEKWDNLLGTASNGADKRTERTTSVSPLLWTNWGQDSGYNALCPRDLAACSTCYGHVYTGSVATAMAQLMKYWNWPQYGTLSNAYTDGAYGTLTCNFASTIFKWTIMPNDTPSADIATLMYATGVAIETSYGYAGSNAILNGVAPSAEYALKNYFCYNSSKTSVLTSIIRHGYTDVAWKSAIENEINNQRPVLYGGDDAVGVGQAWVVDGYDGFGNMHCNWGWHGKDNGYYAINTMVPTVDSNFNTNQSAIIGIAAPTNNLPTMGIQELCVGYTKPLYGGPTGGTWITSDSAVATVNAEGVVTGVGYGTANIFYSVGGSCGNRASLCVVYVLDSNVSLIHTIAGITTASVGVGGYSGDGNPATLARLNLPMGLTTDSIGNIYIADMGNNRIRMVNQAGIITTIAGNGVMGYTGDGVTALSAKLDSPTAVAMDKYGNLYIADRGNNVIRKVDTFGIIFTYAGNGTAGFSGDGGPATAAQLQNPKGIALDTFRNLYIADAANNRIRKVDTLGIITTVAGTGAATFDGDGTATLHSFNQPAGVYVDAWRNMFVADQFNQRIREVDTNGIMTTLAGTGTAGYSGDGGMALSAMLNSPVAVIERNDGFLYVADSANNRVRKVSLTTGKITTMVGTGTAGYNGDGEPATNADISGSSGIYLDHNNKIIFSDTYNQLVRGLFNYTSCDSLTGVAEVTPANYNFKLYPNPNDGTFTIELPKAEKNATILILNLLGSVVQTKELSSNQEQSITINLGNVPRGMYIVCVSTGDYVYRDKVMVR